MMPDDAAPAVYVPPPRCNVLPMLADCVQIIFFALGGHIVLQKLTVGCCRLLESGLACLKNVVQRFYRTATSNKAARVCNIGAHAVHIRLASGFH
jgi:hypothetical protein